MTNKQKNIFIYVLECRSHKFYVGKTNNPQFRFEQHFTSNSTSWTTLYKPIRLYQLIPDCDDLDEDKYTLQYMIKYGIDNVRGGRYSKLKLETAEIDYITKTIISATDKCYKCGNSGHFAKDCNIILDTSSAIFNCKYCNKEFTSLKGTTFHENLHCKNKPVKNMINNEQVINPINNDAINKEAEYIFISQDLKYCNKCLREGHDEFNCYAKENIIGDKIIDDIKVYYCSYCNKEFDTWKGVTCHENLYCKQKKYNTEELTESSEEILVYCCSYCNKEFDTLKGVTCHENLYCKQKNSKTVIECFRCGREGHISNNCYATKHTNGRFLIKN